MPRAADYRLAAGTLRRFGSTAAESAAEHRRSRASDVGADGPVADAYLATMRTIADQLDGASAALAHLATTCDRRAEICDAYARAVAAHDRLPLWERALTRRPGSPAPWVEA